MKCKKVSKKISYVSEWVEKKRVYKKPTQCSACLFFLPRWFLSLHKNRYSIINNCSVVSLCVTQQLILVSRKLSKNFILIFVSTLRNQELGNRKNWELSLFFILLQNYVQEDHTKQKKWQLFYNQYTLKCAHYLFISMLLFLWKVSLKQLKHCKWGESLQKTLTTFMSLWK